MGTRRSKTAVPPTEPNPPSEKPATQVAFLTAAGKWAAGIAATVLSAVLIYYLTGKQPPSPSKPPENAGLTHYDHLSGVIHLDYPKFLEGVTHKSAQDAIIVQFGTMPESVLGFMVARGSGFMRVELRPLSPDARGRRADGSLDADPLLAYLAPPPPWWLRPIAYNRVITTQRGTAPRDWFYLERESGMRVFGPKDVYMFRFEVLEGLMVYLFANVSRKDRTTYREELDRAFGSVTVDPEGARVLFAKPYFEEGLKHGKEKRWEDAVRALQRALTIDPMHKTGRYALAQVYQMKGDYRLAWDQVHALQKMGVQVNEKFLQRLRADYPEPK